jgi:putative transcriptional regulator
MKGDGEMTFGSTVKIVRSKLGYSQEQLARELNISFSTVNRWENGRNKPSQMARELFIILCKNNRIDIDLISTGENLND